MRSTRGILLGLILFHPFAALRADGGAVRLSERRGDYRITAFTAPTPSRVGLVDISVFVQDVASGEPVLRARIMVYATPRDSRGETLCHPATTEAATNKLFKAAIFDLPQSGWWDVAIHIEGLSEPLEVHFEMEVSEALPRVGEMAPWIAWPVGVILLFFVHQGLARRKSR